MVKGKSETVARTWELKANNEEGEARFWATRYIDVDA